MTNDYEKTSRQERAIARWQFKRYKDICESIDLYELRGQGIDHDSDFTVRYQTDQDTDDYISNLRLKRVLEYVRDQYLDDTWRLKVWEVAIGNKSIEQFDDYDQVSIKLQYRVLLEGFCKEWGIDTTRNIRKWGKPSDQLKE